MHENTNTAPPGKVSFRDVSTFGAGSVSSVTEEASAIRPVHATIER